MSAACVGALLLMHWCWLGVIGAAVAAAAGVSTVYSGAWCCLVPMAGTANTSVV